MANFSICQLVNYFIFGSIFKLSLYLYCSNINYNSAHRERELENHQTLLKLYNYNIYIIFMNIGGKNICFLLKYSNGMK